MGKKTYDLYTQAFFINNMLGEENIEIKELK